MHLATGQSVRGMNPDPNMDICILSDSVAKEDQSLFSAYVKNMKIWLTRSQKKPWLRRAIHVRSTQYDIGNAHIINGMILCRRPTDICK